MNYNILIGIRSIARKKKKIYSILLYAYYLHAMLTDYPLINIKYRYRHIVPFLMNGIIFKNQITIKNERRKFTEGFSK